MEFWDNEDCEYCGGALREKHVDITHKVGRKMILVRHIPAGVCTRCGTRYYAANVLKTVEEKAKRGTPRREIRVPVFDYVAT